MDRRPLTYLVSPSPQVNMKKIDPRYAPAIPHPPWCNLCQNFNVIIEILNNGLTVFVLLCMFHFLVLVFPKKTFVAVSCLNESELCEKLCLSSLLNYLALGNQFGLPLFATWHVNRLHIQQSAGGRSIDQAQGPGVTGSSVGLMPELSAQRSTSISSPRSSQ